MVKRLTGFLAIAFLLAASAVHAIVMVPLGDGRVSVEVQASAPTREAALQAARDAAVRNCAGRVLISDQLLMADELLRRYLGNYANEFVLAVEVLEDSFSAGNVHLNSRVFVDFDRLASDLGEKKFLYTPAFRPRFAVFMTELLDGRIQEDGVARVAIANAFLAEGMRPYESDLPTPPATTNVGADQPLLEAAIVSAQRSGVEVILSGEVRTNLVRRQQLVLDDYWFYDAEMSLQLIRVDTGEALYSGSASGSASERDQGDAIRVALERAAGQIASQMVPEFNEFWPAVVQRQAKFELLLTGIDDEMVDLIKQNLGRLGRDARIHVRKKFDNLAVLSVVYDGPKSDLLDAINSTAFPTLSILNPEADRVFEVQVSS